MSITKAFSAPYVLVVNDKEFKFARLSPPEVAELAATIKAHKVAEGKKILDECEVKGIEKVQMLRILANEPETEDSVFRFAATPAGAIRIGRQSLKKAGATEEAVNTAIDSELTVPDLTMAALDVVGWVYQSIEPAKEAKDDTEKKPVVPTTETTEAVEPAK